MTSKFIHHSQSKKFLQSVFGQKYFEIIRHNDSYFSRFEFTFRLFSLSFPISINYITTNSFPHIDKRSGFHIILWDRVKISDDESDIEQVSGWWQARGIFGQRRPPVAYLDLQGVTERDYFKNWSRTAKLFRNRWLRGLAENKYIIEKVDIEEFKRYYKKSTLSNYQKKFYLKQIEQVRLNYLENIKLYLISDVNGKIIAGTGLIEDRELDHLIYMYVFTSKEKKYKHIGVGIIDFAVRLAIEGKISFLNFTPIWEKGQSNSWRGFTKFKLQFNPKLAKCKNTYIKLSLTL